MEKLEVFKPIKVDKKVNYPALLNTRIIVSCIFLMVGLTLYLLNYINFPALCLLIAGAIWNFFLNINSFLAFIFSLIVGILYAFFAIIDGLYVNALLYTIIYIPLQFIVWIQNIDVEDMSIKDDKVLKGNSIYFIILAFIVCFVAGFAINISNEYAVLPILDTFVACGLGLSAYLQSYRYREYYLVRFMALALAVVLWGMIFNMHGASMGSITMILLYLMYMVLDIVAYFFWLKTVEAYDRQEYEEIDEKGRKILIQQKIEEYNKMLKENQVKNFEDNNSLKA